MQPDRVPPIPGRVDSQILYSFKQSNRARSSHQAEEKPRIQINVDNVASTPQFLLEVKASSSRMTQPVYAVDQRNYKMQAPPRQRRHLAALRSFNSS